MLFKIVDESGPLTLISIVSWPLSNMYCYANSEYDDVHFMRVSLLSQLQLTSIGTSDITSMLLTAHTRSNDVNLFIGNHDHQI